jgi:hypothetical protein
MISQAGERDADERREPRFWRFPSARSAGILIRGPLSAYPRGRLLGMSLTLLKGGLDEILHPAAQVLLRD